jgi:hypothetical protein
MKVAFTICSNNYLAKAKVVADTFIENHPEYRFFLFLIDKRDTRVDYNEFSSYAFLEAQEAVAGLEDLARKYNIIELSTAIKPACALYLFEQHQAEIAFYLDPDLQIFNRFTEVEDALYTHNFVLTPHFCSPIDDGKYPSDIDLMVYGIYNLGFIALKNSSESIKLLTWWHERLMKYCFMRPSQGMFTDQLWMNYAPIYFQGAYVLKHLGYNMANWNLYERRLSEAQNRLVVNEEFQLKFFHFSHYQFHNPNTISKHQNRYTLESRSDLKNLFNGYQAKLVKNKQADLENIGGYYNEIYSKVQADIEKQKDLEYYTFKRKLKNKLNSVLSTVLGE